MNAHSQERFWTEQEQEAGNKWVGIALLVILLLVLCFFFVRTLWPTGTKVLAVNFSVGQYGGVLPDPAFPDWQLVGNGIRNRDMPKADNQSANLDNAVAIKKRFQELAADLQDQLDSGDTFVVYLRGHCLAYHGVAYLLGGNFAPESIAAHPERLPSDTAVPIAEIIQSLSRIEAGNVLVLADVCDLPTIPGLGIIANDVPSAVDDAIGSIEDGTPVWFITSAASLQPAHQSWLKQQTLLQAAADYALTPGRIEPEEKLNLAAFYESLVKFSSSMTESKQTPLLFRSGHNGYVDNQTADIWLQAQNVKLANRLNKAAADDEPIEASEPSGSTESPPDANNGSASTTAGNAAGDNAAGDNGGRADTPVQEADPWLRIWQLRDSLLSRNSAAGWSPVDFAIVDWHQQQALVARWERLNRIQPEDSKALDAINGLIERWAAIESALQGKTVQLNHNQPLAAALLDLRERIANQPQLAAWQSPAVLDDAVVEKWRTTREGYRAFADTHSQLAGWLLQALHESHFDPGALDLARQLATQLAEAAKYLPQATEPALDSPVPASLVAKLNKTATELALRNSSQLTELAEKFRSAKSSGTQASAPVNIGWGDEYRFQQYLQRHNGNYTSRRDLIQAYAALTKDDLAAPAFDRLPTADTSLSDILKVSSSDQRNRLRTWCNIVNVSLQAVGPHVVTENPSSSTEDLNRWSLKMLSDFMIGRYNQQSQVMNWMQASLMLLFRTDAEIDSGFDRVNLLLPVSGDSRLRLVRSAGQTEHRLKSHSSIQPPLNFSVQRHNNATVNRCWVQWQYRSVNASRADPLRVMYRARPVEPSTPRPFTLTGANKQLSFLVELDPRIAEDADGGRVELRFSVAESQSALLEDPDDFRDVTVILPRRHRVDLIAEQLSPSLETLKTLRSTWADDGESVLTELAVPAVDFQAKSRYQFRLQNTADEPKTVIVRLYAVQGPSGALGDGHVTDAAKAETRRQLNNLSPLFETAPIALAAAASAADSGAGTAIQFLAPATAGDAGPSVEPGAFGLLCRIQEYIAAASAESLPTPTDVYYDHWIHCAALNPVGSLTTVSAAQPPQGGQFLLRLEPIRTRWTQWEVEKLPVVVTVTDQAGNRLTTSLTSDLDQGMLTNSANQPILRIKPRPGPTKLFVTHVGIGSYPRAINFESRLAGGNNPPAPRNSPSRFLWPQSLQCFAADGTELKPIPWAPSQLPTLNLKPKPTDPAAEESQLARIEIPFGFDAPSATLRVKTPEYQGIQRFPHDRAFYTKFEIDPSAGHLLYSAMATDHRFIHILGDPEISGDLEFAVAIDREPDIAATAGVRIDRTPPEVSDVLLSEDRLNESDSLTVELRAADGQTDIEQIVVGLLPNEFNQSATFAASEPAFQLPAKRQGNNLWRLRLAAEDFAKLAAGLGLKTGDGCWVVCRAIDKAGNVQDECPAKLFTFLGKKKVADEPKEPEPAPPKEKPPAEYAVRIQINLGDGKVADIDKVNISGMAGIDLNKARNPRVFTKVPPSTYPVTATYTDPVNNVYEGEAEIDVSPSAPSGATFSSTITLQLKK